MVDVARRKATALGIPASFLVGDAEALSLEDQSFDLVICNSVYHWFADRARTLAVLGRALRPGGQIVLSCVADPGFEEWVRLVDDVWARLFGERRAWLPPLPTPTELREHLNAAGLAVEHLSYELDTTKVQDVPAFLRTMSVIAPTWIAGIPDTSRNALVRSLSDLMTARYPGGFMLTTAGMGGIARKRRPAKA
jgi:SAM-dependent methyltransferase